MSRIPTPAEELPEVGVLQLPDVGPFTESMALLPAVSDGVIVGTKPESVVSVVSMPVLSLFA